MRLHKKGIGALTGERLVLNFYGILAIVLVFGFFYAVFHFQKVGFQQTIEARTKHLEALPYFTTQLRTPITSNDTTLTVAELMIQSYYANDYAYLTKLMKTEILQNAPRVPLGGAAGWNFELTKMSDATPLVAVKTYDIALSSPIQTVVFTLPLPDQQSTLMASFAMECQGVPCESYAHTP